MTNKLELGKMSTAALGTDSAELNTWDIEYAELMTEIKERNTAHFHGAPGRAPLLTVAQVVATLGPLLVKPQAPEGWSDPDTGWNDAIHACAKALLALPPDAPSPLE